MLVADNFAVATIGRLLGDFNRDGRVTSADIPAMLTGLDDLKSFTTTNNLNSADLISIGDIDGSGFVTNADIQALLTLLISGGSSAVAVPEPTTLVLLAFALPGLAFPIVRRRRGKLQCVLESCKEHRPIGTGLGHQLIGR